VDDHTPFREGLISLFEKFADLKVVFQGSNGNEVMDKLKSHEPDIILTGHFNDSFVLRFIKKKVPSILSKTTPTKIIVEAIRLVHKNGRYYDEAVSAIMAKSIADSAMDSEIKERPELDLNFQEIQVLKLMCLGYSSKQIAEKVHRAERTGDYNRNCIWNKAQIKSKSVSELILFALKHKILTIM